MRPFPVFGEKLAPIAQGNWKTGKKKPTFLVFFSVSNARWVPSGTAHLPKIKCVSCVSVRCWAGYCFLEHFYGAYAASGCCGIQKEMGFQNLALPLLPPIRFEIGGNESCIWGCLSTLGRAEGEKYPYTPSHSR